MNHRTNGSRIALIFGAIVLSAATSVNQYNIRKGTDRPKLEADGIPLPPPPPPKPKPRATMIADGIPLPPPPPPKPKPRAMEPA